MTTIASTQRSGKTRVAVVFGGRSSEHAVSCMSAGSVLANLDPDRFEAVPVGITRDGGWVLGSSDPRRLAISDGALPAVTDGVSLALPGDPTAKNLVLLDPDRAGEVLAGVDVVFPVLHGAYGEDGTIQGLLELAGIPYVGAGVLSSAVAMDKEYAKKLFAVQGLPVGDYAVLKRGQARPADDVLRRLGLPLFVKPARAGSSVGISKVTDLGQLDDAIALARQTDPKVLIEAGIVGREVECAVLEFPDGRVEASLPAEIKVGTDTDWYDFEAKYLDDALELEIPAKLSDEVTERLRASAIEAFHAVDGQGLARVDFFVGHDGELTLNEVNTMPGFTSSSVYPKVWAVTGVDYPTLLSTLIDTAIARGTGLR